MGESLAERQVIGNHMRVGTARVGQRYSKSPVIALAKGFAMNKSNAPKQKLRINDTYNVDLIEAPIGELMKIVLIVTVNAFMQRYTPIILNNTTTIK
jgi:hypothetical protein